MNEDDDLPVLTQILRTGRADREATAVTPNMHAVDALDPRSVARRAARADPLVIGEEPQPVVDEDLVPPFDVAPPMFPYSDTGTPSGEDAVHPANAFVLSQDHDAPQALGVTYDEPEYSVTRPDDPPRTTPAAVADQVRDAVLERLSARIDTELDARIAQALHVELETALAQLQGNLRRQLNEALKDVVVRAVDEEMARIAAQPKIDLL